MSDTRSERRLFDAQTKAAFDWWLPRLQPPWDEACLPVDRRRSAVPSLRRRVVSFVFPSSLQEQLQRSCNGSPLLVYTCVLAATAICLQRYRGGTRFLVGSPTLRKGDQAEVDDPSVHGPLPIAMDLTGDPPLGSVLTALREDLTACYQQQRMPFDELVRALGLPQHDARCPLVDVVVGSRALHEPLRTTGNDVTVWLDDEERGLKCEAEYNARLFEAETIERFMGHLTSVLSAGLSSLDTPVPRLPLLQPGEERRTILDWSGQSESGPSEPLCLHELVRRQAARTPDAIALVDGDWQVSYAALVRSADVLVARLQAVKIGREQLVGIMSSPTADALIALLAVLEAGATCVPIDPSLPDERILQMLRVVDSLTVVLADRDEEERIQRVLADGELAEKTSILGLTVRDHPSGPIRRTRVAAADLAYVLFTSGSTGVPKAVSMPHEVVSNLLSWQRESLEREGDSSGMPRRTLQLTSLSFDVSFQEIFSTWAEGGALILVPNDRRRDIAELPELLLRQQIERVFLPFVALQQLAVSLCGRELFPASLLEVITAGEQLRATQEIIDTFAQLIDTSLHNHYGPCETHVVTAHRLEAPAVGWPALPPIGRPVAGAQLFVLDRFGNPLPALVEGELHIAGLPLARGYAGSPSLTAERFVPCPFGVPGARMYRSGDMVRHLSDGTLEFVARSDDQVKIRGYRVELGEVGTVLSTHPDVCEAIALAPEGDDGNRRIVCWYTSAFSVPPPTSELRDFLALKLPPWMVPTAIHTLESWPTTSSGKIDLRALANMRHVPEGVASEARPSTPIEAALARIWCEVLGREDVGVRDNFLELGGDSLLGTEMVWKVQEAGYDIRLRHVFLHPTIQELATVCVNSAATREVQGDVVGPAPLTPIQRWFFDLEIPKRQRFSVVVVLQASRELERDAIAAALSQLIVHHDALRSRFTEGSDGWHQSHAPTGEDLDLITVDLGGLSAEERRARILEVSAERQDRSDLSRGPLLTAALLRDASGADCLLIALHHIVTDAVSWRILLRDLQTGYEQHCRGMPFQFPRKTTAFRDFSRRLRAQARSAVGRGELDLWRSFVGDGGPSIPVDHQGGPNLQGSVRKVRVLFTKAETSALLRAAPAIHGARVDAVLIAAVLRAFAPWTGRRELLLQMEGHGREEVFEDVNLSRTVGWFTAMYPLLFRLSDDDDTADAVARTQNRLMQVPMGGIGYGLVRYLADGDGEKLADLPQPQVSFNYLGQMGPLFEGVAMFRSVDDNVGTMIDPGAVRTQLVHIAAEILTRRLRVSFEYSENFHRPSTIEELSGRFSEALRGLLALEKPIGPSSGGSDASG